MHDSTAFDPAPSLAAPRVAPRAPNREAGLFGALLPGGWEGIFARGIGVAGLVFAAFAAVALVSWNAADPSVTHAKDGDPSNWMGFAGASLSDVAMQLFGLAAPIGIIFVGLRSWHRARFGLDAARGPRGLAALLSTAFAAAVIGCMPMFAAWPLAGSNGAGIGLGGIVGDTLLSLPRGLTGAWPAGFWAIVLACLYAVPAFWFARFALARRTAAPHVAEPTFDDESAFDDAERSGIAARLAQAFAAPLGLLVHVGYSARSSLRRTTARIIRNARARHAERIERESLEAGAGVADAFVETARREPIVEGAPQFGDVPPVVAPEAFETPETESDEPLEIAPVEGGLRAAMRRAAFAPTPVAEENETEFEQLFDEDDGWETPAIEPAGAPATGTGAVAAPNGDPRVGPARFTTPLVHPLAPRPDEEPLPPMPAAGATASAPQPAARPETPAPAPAAAPAVTRRKAGPPAGAPERFALPGIEHLAPPRKLVEDPALSEAQLEDNARRLEGVLGDFGVKGAIIKVRPGPVVTLYELEPAPGIKSSRVIGLADDIARSMEAISARVAVVPGRNAIGIELPNARRETVYLSEQFRSPTFRDTKAKLGMALGKTIGGEPVIADLAKMPHLLVAGTTGSGKSVAINTMILSLLYKHDPSKCRLIMVDPKMVELSVYDGIPHLLTPVVTDPKKAVVALKWTVREMEQRYAKMSKVGVRNVDGFNARVAEAAAKGEAITRTVQTGYDHETGEALYETEEFDLEAMPYIVVIIDEVADLMMVAGKEIEGAVQRLGQMARAAGIHVIMATQRPSTDVITGTIKANFPTRISFQVTSKIDSRVMLGEAGAEQLLGMGDMLHMAGGGRIERVHGPFVSDDEVEKIVAHLKLQGVPDYLDAITADEDEEDEDAGGAAGGGSGAAGDMADSDDPYDQAVAVVLRDRKVSTSYIQRRLGIGYNRAASLIERMEQEGLIGPANHAGKRDILVPAEDETI